MSEKYHQTPAQILLRWNVQHGCVVLPKSVTPSRIEENMKILDFTISEEDVFII